jgi:hypothetical protein
MRKIVQIATPHSDVFAVFVNADACIGEATASDLWLEACPVLGVIEDEDGFRTVAGLYCDRLGYAEPSGFHFLGYASSREDAVRRYISSRTGQPF